VVTQRASNGSSGSGISESIHQTLDTLTHNIAETNYLEITRSSGKITDVIIWETAAKLKKIREYNITRTSGKISSVVAKQYDSTGALKNTLTSTITRTSGRISSISEVYV